ncbi:hypothetical protein ACFC09_29145 [Streptomyces sp. NPDC056161]|uniref:hypothetical protein n=1 Tax=Streptomyces sp. NPDC056161 TaxID=3345732 RepID=UPI0035E0F344
MTQLAAMIAVGAVAECRVVLGSPALGSTLGVLRQWIDDFEAQRDLAASTDFPAGE